MKQEEIKGKETQINHGLTNGQSVLQSSLSVII